MSNDRDEREAIVHRLRACLQAADAKRFGLSLIEKEIEHQGTWWHVPVASDMPHINPFDYAPILNRIEEEFDSAGTKLLLIPAGSDETETD